MAHDRLPLVARDCHNSCLHVSGQETKHLGTRAEHNRQSPDPGGPLVTVRSDPLMVHCLLKQCQQLGDGHPDRSLWGTFRFIPNTLSTGCLSLCCFPELLETQSCLFRSSVCVSCIDPALSQCLPQSSNEKVATLELSFLFWASKTGRSVCCGQWITTASDMPVWEQHV